MLGDSTAGGTDRVARINIADHLTNSIGDLVGGLSRIAPCGLGGLSRIAPRMTALCCIVVVSIFAWCTLLGAALDGVDPGSIPAASHLADRAYEPARFVRDRRCGIAVAHGFFLVRWGGQSACEQTDEACGPVVFRRRPVHRAGSSLDRLPLACLFDYCVYALHICCAVLCS